MFTPLQPLAGGGGGGGGGFPSADNFVFVDSQADPGGDGSAAKPYKTILEGSLNNNGGSKIVWVMRGSYNERAFIRTGTYIGWDVFVVYDGAGGPIIDTNGISFDAKLFGNWQFNHIGLGAVNHAVRINDGDSALWIERASMTSDTDVGVSLTAGSFTLEKGSITTNTTNVIDVANVGTVARIGDVTLFSNEGSCVQFTNGGTLVFGGKAQCFGPPCLFILSGAPSIHLLSTARLYNNNNDQNSIISTPAINVQSYGAIATIDVDANTTIIGSLLIDGSFVAHV